MLKKLLNHAMLEIGIKPIDPLLIKSGQATVGGVDMAFVRTYRFACAGGAGAKPFIPGSSLKGVIRSYAEKICRSLRDEPVPVCLPYLDQKNETQDSSGQASCGLRFDKLRKDKHDLSSSEIYRMSCPTCRLFGSLGFMGRFASSDAYPITPCLIERRDGVAIDRVTGGAAPRAKYDLEVLTKGEFSATLEIRNFELWQLALVGLVLRDMEDGLVSIGSGKSRGLGRIKADVRRFSISYFGRRVDSLGGLWALCSEQDRKAYGLFEEKKGEKLPEPVQSGIRWSHDIASVWKGVLEPAVQDLLEFIQRVDWPGALDAYSGRGR